MTCFPAAVFVHFAFIATFSWLNVMSFDIWWTFRYENKYSYDSDGDVRYCLQSYECGQARSCFVLDVQRFQWEEG